MSEGIDLGSEGPCCVSTEPPKAPEKYYPSVTYDGPNELDLPDEGEMTIRFKKTRTSESDYDGKKRHSCTFEVREILKVDGEKPEVEVEAPAGNSKNDAEEALDTLMKAHMESKAKSKGY